MNKPNDQEATYSSNIPVAERRSRRNAGSNNDSKVVDEVSGGDFMGPSFQSGKSNSSPLNVKSKRIVENSSHFNMPSTEQWVERSRGNKNIRRSTRDIKRPKFDDEIIDPNSIKLGIRKGRFHTDQGFEEDFMEDPPGIVGGGKKRHSIASPTKSAVMSILEAAGGKIKESDSMKEKEPQRLPRSNSMKEKTRPGISDQSLSSLPSRSETQKNNGQELLRRKRIRENKSISVKKPTPLIYENPIHQGIVDEIVKKWEAYDDIVLMAGVQHLCDLPAVLAQSKFTKDFTLTDLDERWYLMLYDEQVSTMIRKRISEQPKSLVQKIYHNLPFSIEEDRAIQNFVNTFEEKVPVLADFDRLLKTSKSAFNQWRTPGILYERFKFLRKHKLVVMKKDRKNGKGEPGTPGKNPMHDEIEQNLDFCNLAQKDVPTDDPTRNLTEIEKQYLESKKAPHEAIAGTNLSPQMPSNILAQLRGCCVSFNIVAKQVVIGRSTEQFAVDVNLNYEGPCQRVSRAQAVLKLNDNDEFVLYNTGRNPIFADKKVIQPNQKVVLESNTVVEFGILSLLFLRNETALKLPANERSFGNNEDMKVFTEVNHRM
ncbi:hypothetical protein FO519_001987 [Halicephalobus sp. NKZ332]|nr:hypothetical protein FO519_001987 [Halicephalobus sp. NKZ332]